MTSDNKSLELSPRVLAGKKEFSRWNSQSWAVVGGATQLYVGFPRTIRPVHPVGKCPRESELEEGEEALSLCALALLRESFRKRLSA
jgi:hypothetical protein